MRAFLKLRRSITSFLCFGMNPTKEIKEFELLRQKQTPSPFPDRQGGRERQNSSPMLFRPVIDLVISFMKCMIVPPDTP